MPARQSSNEPSVPEVPTSVPSAGPVSDASSDQGQSPRTAAPDVARKLRQDAEEFEDVAAVIPRPFTSHVVVANLAQTQESLADSLRDLADWHDNASEGTEFEDVDGEGVQGAQNAAERLQEAAELADQLKATLHEALDENGRVRWLDDADGIARAERHSESSWTRITTQPNTTTTDADANPGTEADGSVSGGPK